MTIQVKVENGIMDLSRVLTYLQSGQEVVLTQAGQPVARVLLPEVPTAETAKPLAKKRQPGTAVGLITIHDTFDDPLPDDFMTAFS